MTAKQDQEPSQIGIATLRPGGTMVDLQVRAETTDEQAEIVGGPLLGDAFFEMTPDQLRAQGWRLAGPLVVGEPVAVLAVEVEA